MTYLGKREQPHSNQLVAVVTHCTEVILINANDKAELFLTKPFRENDVLKAQFILPDRGREAPCLTSAHQLQVALKLIY